MLSLSLLGCGDDSKPIAEQWPDYTAGNTNQSSQSSTTTDSSASTSTQGVDTSSASSSAQGPGGTTSSSGLETLPGGTQAPGMCTPDNFRCVAPVPTGWHGPVARRGMAANGVVGACQGEYRYPINAVKPFRGGPSFEAAMCSPCSCGRAQGARCGDLLAAEYYQQDSCKEYLLGVPRVYADGACVEVPNAVGFTRSIKLSTPSVDRSAAFCSPTGGFVTKAPASWRRQERWCRARVADRLRCNDASLICVPKIEAGFEAGVCIFQEGEHSCPAGEYANQVLLYREEQDERGCSACSCGEVRGSLGCDGFLRQYSNARCNGASTERVESTPVKPDQSDVCRNMSNFNDIAPRSVQLELSVIGLNEASCQAAGGEAVGQVRGKDPVTLCCTAN